MEDFTNIQNPEYSEHSAQSKAKRVIDGALAVTMDGGAWKAAEASAAIGADLVLTKGKAYRIISDGDIHMKMGNVGVIATTTDLFVPAGKAVNVIMSGTVISTVAGPTAGTFVQAVEISI